ncbi:hypothetical protein GOODEAATRI_012741, partial [Goodea atripinnis]
DINKMYTFIHRLLRPPQASRLFQHVFLFAARKSLSPVLDSSGSSLLVKRRSPEEMEKDLRGAEAAAELSLHPKDGIGAVEGQTVFPSSFVPFVSLPVVLKPEVVTCPLVSLGSSSSDQASTSTKPQYSVEQQLYGASGSRDEIFSLGGPSYMTASKACSGRTLGCDSDTSHAAVNIASPHHHVIQSFLPAAGRRCWSASQKV